jgi:succinate-semialdehyde dehydrogenase/glutarate-semialdehyde dehydrogenase
LAAREVLIADIDEVVALITRQQGKPNVKALTAEVLSVIDLLAYYAEHAPQFLAPEEVTFHQPHLMGRQGQILHEPLGVVGIISPWNMPFLLSSQKVGVTPTRPLGYITRALSPEILSKYPFLLPMIPVITALAAGNTVVLKPFELTPLIGLKIAEIFHQAGLPSGVLNVIPGDGDTGAALVTAEGIGRRCRN